VSKSQRFSDRTAS
ncbi:hypothetical protein AB1N83_009956, partial [Pleurotus pulmonarius]